MEAGGGVDAFLDEHAMIVMADHSHTHIERVIDFTGPFSDWKVLQPSGANANSAELALCPAQRSAMVYLLLESRDRAAEDRRHGARDTVGRRRHQPGRFGRRGHRDRRRRGGLEEDSAALPRVSRAKPKSKPGGGAMAAPATPSWGADEAGRFAAHHWPDRRRRVGRDRDAGRSSHQRQHRPAGDDPVHDFLRRAVRSTWSAARPEAPAPPSAASPSGRRRT